MSDIIRFNNSPSRRSREKRSEIGAAAVERISQELHAIGFQTMIGKGCYGEADLYFGWGDELGYAAEAKTVFPFRSRRRYRQRLDNFVTDIEIQRVKINNESLRRLLDEDNDFTILVAEMRFKTSLNIYKWLWVTRKEQGFFTVSPTGNRYQSISLLDVIRHGHRLEELIV